MKMNLKNNMSFAVVFAFAIGLFATSCMKSEDSAGYEYMPDMYRSPAIEAYVDYGVIGDSIAEDLQVVMSAKVPPMGTIPYTSNKEDAMVNMPYKYPNTNDGYEAAGRELTNPLTFSEDGLAKGKDLYTKFCQHCHGESGKGDGKVITFGKHSKPGAYDVALKDLSVGKMFHTLTYGKGAMGSHASQLTKKERWEVIFYIQALQNGGKYPETGNNVVSDSTKVETPELAQN